MSRGASSSIVLCSAMAVPTGTAPEWIHLLPAGAITTQDGRGPYKVTSMATLAAQLNAGGKLAVDECHSTDLAAPSGAPAPARGWIVESEARANGDAEDGLWGRVEWTGQGRALMEDGAYNGISPVILHTKANAVVGVLRASLTNAPNLKGLTALHSQADLAQETEGTGMDWKMKLSEMLGLGADASDEDVLAAFEKKMAAPAPAMQSQQSVTEHPAYIALQGEVTDLATQLNAQSAATKRKDAVAFVDAAINEGRAGVKAARDEYIEMHMENPKRVAKLFGAMSIIKGAALPSEAAPSAGAADGLDDGDRHVIALMGLSETEYQESLAASGNKKAL